MLTLQCGNRNADAAPADLLSARPGLGRSHRRPPDRAGPGSQRHVPPPVVRQAVRRTAACTPLPRELPATTEPAVAVLAGTAEVKPAPLDLPNLSRLLYLSAGVVRTMERDYGIHPFRAAGSAGGRFPLELYVAVPPGGALPAGVHWYDPLEHALVQVGPPPRGGGAGRRRHRHPVAHRLALPGTRLPAHLLGRRHDAGPAAGARRLGRPARRAVHPLPRRGGGRADRRGPGARVPGGGRRPGRGAARPRPGRPGGPRRGGRRAAGVPPGHGGPAGRGERPARPGVGPRPPGATCPSSPTCRSRASSPRAGPSGGWTRAAACPRTCCAPA